MNYENIKVADSVTSENDYVVNEVGLSKRSFMKTRKEKLDPLDVAILPTALGLAVSFGYLIYNIVKAAGLSGGIATISSFIGNIFG
ncbi:MAG: hypothetical protein LBT55_05955 [Clostridiaceae bacterium]|jgi:hypothetical protein|nr:hypothetical protein [Clostridiaceae bacterium]